MTDHTTEHRRPFEPATLGDEGCCIPPRVGAELGHEVVFFRLGRGDEGHVDGLEVVDGGTVEAFGEFVVEREACGSERAPGLAKVGGSGSGEQAGSGATGSRGHGTAFDDGRRAPMQREEVGDGRPYDAATKDDRLAHGVRIRGVQRFVTNAGLLWWIVKPKRSGERIVDNRQRERWMHTRFFSLFVAGVACLALVSVACGGDDDDGSSNTPAATNTTATGAESPTTAATAGPTEEIPSELTITAQDISFDKSTLTIKAGVETTITMVNNDAIGHNFHVVAGSVDEAITPPFTKDESPKSLTVTIDAPGTYQFNCDVHPSAMFGTIEVVE